MWKHEDDIFSNKQNEYGIYDLKSAYDYLMQLNNQDEELKELINLISEEMDYEDEEHYSISYELVDRTIKYLNDFKKLKKKKTNNIEKDDSLEQLSLFESKEDALANKICDIFNSFDTKYQNTFEISNVELQEWEHIKSKKRNLTIILKSSLVEDFADSDNSFTYFNVDKTDEIKLNNSIANNYFLQELYKDKGFSISFTPNMIHIYWHNFDDKTFNMDISNTKLVNQSEIDNQELEKIDNEISTIDNYKKDYKVTTNEIMSAQDNIETNIIEEIEKYPKINYYIDDDKVDTGFGAKSRYEDNVKSIELLKKLEIENRNATKEEQDILARYVGWGGIADAFDERKENWKSEREKLKF